MDDEMGQMHGPVVSAEWLAKRRVEQEREHDHAEQLDSQGWLREMKERIDADAAAWLALPCQGGTERVSACSDAFESTCERRDHGMCGRKQVKREQERTARDRLAQRDKLLKGGAPPKVMAAVFDRAPAETEAVRLMRDAAGREPRPTFVILTGVAGCGKTSAAVVWATEERARFVTAPELAKASPYDAENDWMHRAHALVIDDLGTEYLDPKGFFLANFDALVNHRYAHELPTVVTTNLTVEQFKRYGERVCDRFREAAVIMSVKSKSMRRKA